MSEKMIGLRSYQDIKTPEDYEYERCVDRCYNELCEEYADEIAEHGMTSSNKFALRQRARQMAKERMSSEYEEQEEENA